MTRSQSEGRIVRPQKGMAGDLHNEVEQIDWITTSPGPKPLGEERNSRDDHRSWRAPPELFEDVRRIYDPIRCEWVADQPEERVRQALLLEMVGPLGFPRELIAVERGVDQMPHLALTNQNVPKRRADIVAFYRVAEALCPLLLVECKAVRLTRRAMLQVAGYNHFLKAPFICLVNDQQIQVGWFDEEWCFIPRLPHFDELIHCVSGGPFPRENQISSVSGK